MKAPAESPTMKPTMNDVPEDNALAGQATNNSATVNEADTGYGKTNIQTAGVEEADILKMTVPPSILCRLWAKRSKSSRPVLPAP